MSTTTSAPTSQIIAVLDAQAPEADNLEVMREAQLRASDTHPVYRIVVDGSGDDTAIVGRAREHHAALIVLAPGHERFTITSLAGKVIRHARCPVLIARQSPPRGPVIGATDFSDASFPALAAASAQALLLGEPLLIAHVLPAPADAGIDGLSMGAATGMALDHLRRDAEHRLATLVRERTLTAEPVLLDGMPASALDALAETRLARLLVVGTHGRTGLGRLLIGSVAEHVARHAPCSVLIVPLLAG